VDIQSGRLEWLVNGYETLGAATSGAVPALAQAAQKFDALKDLLPFHLGEMKFPETKIGEFAARVEQAAPKLQDAVQKIGSLAEQVGDLAGKAGQWLAEAQVHGPQPPQRPPAPQARIIKGIPKPPPMPPSQRPPRKK
jgi:hypothetical protein